MPEHSFARHFINTTLFCVLSLALQVGKAQSLESSTNPSAMVGKFVSRIGRTTTRIECPLSGACDFSQTNASGPVGQHKFTPTATSAQHIRLLNNNLAHLRIVIKNNPEYYETPAYLAVHIQSIRGLIDSSASVSRCWTTTPVRRFQPDPPDGPQLALCELSTSAEQSGDAALTHVWIVANMADICNGKTPFCAYFFFAAGRDDVK